MNNVTDNILEIDDSELTEIVSSEELFPDKILKTNKSNYYLTAKDLMFEYNKSVEEGNCTEKLLKYFEIIARHVSRLFFYANKNDLDACINYAVAEAYFKWRKYNPDRTLNIFSLYTTMIKNDLQTHYNYLTRHSSSSISIESLYTNNNDR
jgi:hypothetical protein